jgi:hypothetical protein
MSSVSNIVVVHERKIVIQHVGVQGPPGAGPLFKHEPRTLTETEASNNKLFLANQADQYSLILFNIRGAPTQIRNIDYEYISSENAISWAGLGLDSFLVSQEVVEIIYLPVN